MSIYYAGESEKEKRKLIIVFSCGLWWFRFGIFFKKSDWYDYYEYTPTWGLGKRN